MGGSVPPFTFATHNFPTVVKVISRVKLPQLSSYFQAFIGAPCHHPPSNYQLWAYFVVFPCIGNAVQERRYKTQNMSSAFLCLFSKVVFFLKKVQPGGSHLDRFHWPKRTCCLVVSDPQFSVRCLVTWRTARSMPPTVRHVEYQSGGCRHNGTAIYQIRSPWRFSGESTSWRNVEYHVHQ